jgi:hypothetical protein
MKLANLYKLFDDTKTENKSKQMLITNYLNAIKNTKQRRYENDKEKVLFYERLKKKMLARM